jgi:hypothetical protein
MWWHLRKIFWINLFFYSHRAAQKTWEVALGLTERAGWILTRCSYRASQRDIYLQSWCSQSRWQGHLPWIVGLYSQCPRCQLPSRATFFGTISLTHTKSVLLNRFMSAKSRNIIHICPSLSLFFQGMDHHLFQKENRSESFKNLFSSETGVNPIIRSWKSTHLNELDARKPLVVSISQKSEELRLYNLV